MKEGGDEEVWKIRKLRLGDYTAKTEQRQRRREKAERQNENSELSCVYKENTFPSEPPSGEQVFKMGTCGGHQIQSTADAV